MKTVVYTDVVQRVLHASVKTAYTVAIKTHYVIPVCTTVFQDQPSGSKHVEDIKKLKINVLIYKRCILLVFIV